MTPTSLPLDCLPLDSATEASLSSEQLRAAEALQRVLLSPHDYASIDAWRAAVNREVAAATGGDAAMFQLMLPGVDPHFSEDLCMERLEAYPEYMPAFGQQRGIFARAMSLGAGNRYMLWLDHLEWLYGSTYFNELIADLKAFDTLFAAAPSPGSRYPAMLHVYHERRRGGPRFDAGDVRLMRLVQPALQAGVRAAARSLASRASFTASLDSRRDGALVLNREGKLLYRNPSFADLVPLHPDRDTVVDAGREMARGLLSDDERLRFDPETARKAVPVGEAVLLLTAVLVGEGVFDVGPVVLVILHADEPRPSDGRTLRDRFGLTPRQAEVARLLAGRLSNAEIAERLHVSPNTARHHTEAVMDKLEVRDRRLIHDRILDREAQSAGG